MKRFSLLPLAVLAAVASTAPAASQSSWCSCIPAWDCEAGDSQCANLKAQAEAVLRDVIPDCRADAECSRMLDETCAQICQAIQANDPGLLPDRAPAADDDDTRPRRTFEDETKAKEKKEKEKKDEEKEKQPQECKELILYRDGQLRADWDLQKTKFDLTRDALQDAKKLRDEINDDNWWTLSAIPDIALAVKTACDIVSGVLATVSPSGNVINLAKDMEAVHLDPGHAARVEKIYKGIKEGQRMSKLAQEEFGEFTFSLVVKVTGQVGAAANLLKTTAQNIEKAKTLGKEKDAYRQTLREQTENLESSMKRYEASMKLAMQNMDAVNAVKEAIDRYCSKPKPEPVTVPPPG